MKILHKLTLGLIGVGLAGGYAASNFNEGSSNTNTDTATQVMVVKESESLVPSVAIPKSSAAPEPDLVSPHTIQVEPTQEQLLRWGITPEEWAKILAHFDANGEPLLYDNQLYIYPSGRQENNRPLLGFININDFSDGSYWAVNEVYEQSMDQLLNDGSDWGNLNGSHEIAIVDYLVTNFEGLSTHSGIDITCRDSRCLIKLVYSDRTSKFPLSDISNYIQSTLSESSEAVCSRTNRAGKLNTIYLDVSCKKTVSKGEMQ